MAKIVLNLNRGFTFGAFVVALILIGVIGVYAYTATGTGGNPAVFGHSVNEMDWTKTIAGQVKTSGGYCIGTNCITAWPAGGGGGGGTVTGSGAANYIAKFTGASSIGNSAIFDNGNVGIGTASPGAKLDVIGDIRTSGKVTAIGLTMPTGAGANKVLTSDASGAGAWSSLGSFVRYTTCTATKSNQVACTAACPAGYVVIAGGCSSTPGSYFYSYVRSSQPTPSRDGWICDVAVAQSASGSQRADGTAICIPA